MKGKGLSPYTQKVNFQRVADFWDSFNSENPYSLFLEKNRQLFKNVYITEKIDITYKQAIKRIKNHQNIEFRDWALFMLENGLRFSESLTIESGRVIGKGGKVREVLYEFKGTKKWSKSSVYFWQLMKGIGLKPHTLRKLAATRMIKKGVSVTDVCHILGWSSPQTAMRYVQQSSLDKLREVLK
jgi:hypothetical protein